MLGFVISLALALTSHGAAAQAREANFPIRGAVVPGKSIGGVSLGMTEAAVQRKWGRRYTVYRYSSLPTWLYEYTRGEPLGAAVKFQDDHVVAVFTLGSPAGWGLKGVMMGDPVSNVYGFFADTSTVNCIGYDALIVHLDGGTTSFYSASGVIYGYALTAPSQPACQ